MRPASSNYNESKKEISARVSSKLGHTQVQTTARYAHLARDSVKVSASKIADSTGADILKELAAVSRALVEVVKASSSIRHERRRVLDEVADAAKDAARQKGLSADAVAAIREAIEGGKEET